MSKHEDLSFIPGTHIKEPVMGMSAVIPVQRPVDIWSPLASRHSLFKVN